VLAVGERQEHFCVRFNAIDRSGDVAAFCSKTMGADEVVVIGE
jgi:hypothetical protein